MSQTVAAAAARPARGGREIGVLAFSLAATVAAAVPLLHTGSYALVGLLGVAFALGWVFLASQFGYTGGFRRLVAARDGSSLAAGLLVPAVAPAASAATATTAWQNGSFHVDTPNVVRRSDLVLGAPNSQAAQSLPLGNGSLGAAAWAAGGFTAQLNRADTLPGRKSPGQVQIPGLSRLTGASDFHGALDTARGSYMAQNRQGETTEIPLLSLSIGIVSSEVSRIESFAHLASRAAEVKHAAKAQVGNAIVRDRRLIERPS